MSPLALRGALRSPRVLPKILGMKDTKVTLTASMKKEPQRHRLRWRRRVELQARYAPLAFHRWLGQTTQTCRSDRKCRVPACRSILALSYQPGLPFWVRLGT